MEENFLIKLETKEEQIVKTWWSKNITELLHLFLMAKDNEIPIDIPCESGFNHSKYDGAEAYVDSVRIRAGGVESLLVLNVIVEVI